MKKSIPKRILSVFLALLMFFTTFPVGAIQAFAVLELPMDPYL